MKPSAFGRRFRVIPTYYTRDAKTYLASNSQFKRLFDAVTFAALHRGKKINYTSNIEI